MTVLWWRSLQDRRQAASRRLHCRLPKAGAARSEEHTSELQSLMRISYAVFCLKKKHRTLLDHYLALTMRKLEQLMVENIQPRYLTESDIVCEDCAGDSLPQ